MTFLIGKTIEINCSQSKNAKSWISMLVFGDENITVFTSEYVNAYWLMLKTEAGIVISV